MAGVLATAGPRVGSREYSTRRISLMTGISQSLVSRAMRQIRGADGALRVDSGDRTLRVSAFVVEFPRIRIEFSTGGSDMPGESQAFNRRSAALMAALRISGADAWPTTQRAQGAEAIELVEGQALAGEGLTAETVRVLWEPGRQQWDAFLAQVAGLLDACGHAVDGVPGDLLAALSVRVGQGLHGVVWQRSEQSQEVSRGLENSSPFDSKDEESAVRAAWPTPGIGELSMAEQVAIALRKEITDSGYSAGDRVSSGVLAAHMGIRQSAVRAALRRLVDDGLLASHNGVFSLPLVTGADIIDLYAARLQVGTVLLRACVDQPRHRLLGAQMALRTLEAAAARGDGVRVDQADLYFQQELAEASGLSQSARTFHSLTLRLQMFISVLQLNYRQAIPRILADDRQVMNALIGGNATMAVWTWRSKLDNAVRHMSAASPVVSRTGPRTRFDVVLWENLTGV